MRSDRASLQISELETEKFLLANMLQARDFRSGKIAMIRRGGYTNMFRKLRGKYGYAYGKEEVSREYWIRVRKIWAERIKRWVGWGR